MLQGCDGVSANWFIPPRLNLIEQRRSIGQLKRTGAGAKQFAVRSHFVNIKAFAAVAGEEFCGFVVAYDLFCFGIPLDRAS